MGRALTPLPAPLRIALAAALLACAVVLLLRFAATVGAGGVWAPFVQLTLGVLAALAGAGLWRETRWAPAALIGLGSAFAASRLVEALVLGIRPWLIALLSAAAGLVVALVIAAAVGERSRPVS
jgi:hypothetical protein